MMGSRLFARLTALNYDEQRWDKTPDPAFPILSLVSWHRFRDFSHLVTQKLAGWLYQPAICIGGMDRQERFVS